MPHSKVLWTRHGLPEMVGRNLGRIGCQRVDEHPERSVKADIDLLADMSIATTTPSPPEAVGLRRRFHGALLFDCTGQDADIVLSRLSLLAWSLAPRVAGRSIEMQNEIAELPGRRAARALPIDGFLFQLPVLGRA